MTRVTYPLEVQCVDTLGGERALPPVANGLPGATFHATTSARGVRRLSTVTLVAIALSIMAFATAGRAQEVFPRIINGAVTDDFESVGIVGSLRYPEGFASGTLITSRHVLTAAHVAEVMDGPTDGVFLINDDIYFTMKVTIHPGYNRNTLDNDIAILELSEAVTGVTPSEINVAAPIVGDRVTLVGYGAGGDDSGADGTFGKKMVGTTTIDYVGETFIAWDFDAGESNTAAGDSGGPAYLEIEGKYFIAGITSSGTDPDAAIGDYSVDTRVDAYADWIAGVLESSDDDTPDDDADDDTPCPPNRPGGHRPGQHRPGQYQPGPNRPGQFHPGPHRPGLQPGIGIVPGHPQPAVHGVPIFWPAGFGIFQFVCDQLFAGHARRPETQVRGPNTSSQPRSASNQRASARTPYAPQMAKKSSPRAVVQAAQPAKSFNRVQPSAAKQRNATSRR